MRNLLYKELTLNINKFFYVLPLLLSCLFFIPQWFYSIVLMYFFWISVTNIYSAYSAQQDYHFISVLPVSKKDVVQSKIYAFVILELIHLGLAAIFGIVHNLIYGAQNWAMDVNAGFFAVMIVTFALFNIIFLPAYFKTAYKFGKPVIAGIVTTLLFVAFFEYSAFKFPQVTNVLESPNPAVQIALLVGGIVISVVLTIITLRLSIQNYENVDQ